MVYFILKFFFFLLLFLTSFHYYSYSSFSLYVSPVHIGKIYETFNTGYMSPNLLTLSFYISVVRVRDHMCIVCRRAPSTMLGNVTWENFVSMSCSFLPFFLPQLPRSYGQFFQVKLNNCIANQDSGRQGSEVLISPNKMYSAVKDSRNRILLVDNYSRTIVQMWRGYHRYSTQRLYTLYIGNVTTTHTQTKCGLLFYIKLIIF